jgi:hypothetical protein
VETQLTAMERRMDKALEVRSDGCRRLLHLEIVVDPASNLAARMHEYASMLVMALHAAAGMKGGKREEIPPIKSVALLLSGRAKPWEQVGELRTSWPEPDLFSGHRFQIEPVYQRRVDELLARPGAFWLVFAPLAVDATADSMRRVLDEIRRREPQVDERAALLGTLLVVAELNTWGHNLEEEIRSMLQDSDFEKLMESRTFREVFERTKTKCIVELLQSLFMRRLQRELTPDERAALSSRAATLNSEQASAMHDLPTDALKAWLLGPDAE